MYHLLVCEGHFLEDILHFRALEEKSPSYVPDIQSTLFCQIFWCVFRLSQMIKKPVINSLSANPTKWSNLFKQFVGKLLVVILALKGLIFLQKNNNLSNTKQKLSLNVIKVIENAVNEFDKRKSYRSFLNVYRFCQVPLCCYVLV